MNAGRALLLTVVCAAPLAGEAQARAGQAGVVVGWGTTYMPPVEAGTRFRAVTAQVGELAITSDGTVVAWGGESAGWAVPAGPERRHRHRRGRLEQRGSGRRSGADAPGAAAGRPGASDPERNCRMALHGQRLDRPRELDALDGLRGDQRRYADC